jgi:hypothetical protein
MSLRPSEDELARMEALSTNNGDRRPVRTRLATALVRLSARLDPEVALNPVHREELDDLIDARMAASLR